MVTRVQIGSAQVLGTELRRLRKARGLTQTELATSIGTTRRLISAMEKGERGVSIETVLNAIVELGADIYLEPRS